MEIQNEIEAKKEIKENFFKIVFGRLRDIFRPNFLQSIISGEKIKGTFKFWFFINTIAALIFFVIAVSGIYTASKVGIKVLNEKYPDAAFTIKDGQLSTTGIEEPIFMENKEDNSIFVLDTMEKKYDVSILGEYAEGVFISSEKIYNKKNEFKTEEVSFKSMGEFYFSEKQLVEFFDRYGVAIVLGLGFLIFLFSLMYFVGFRLIVAAWWALFLWLLGLVFSVKDLTFQKAYFAVLNFYAIPMIIVAALMFFAFEFSFFTTLIFLIVFAVNIIAIKKENSKNSSLKEISTNS